MSDNTQQQIARLREQVETLMKERVTPAVANVADRAQGAVKAVRGQAETLSSGVQEQPIVALLVAAGIGYLLGRVLR